MKDLTIKDFCKQFNACASGREWACHQLPAKENAMMSELWPLIESRPSDLRWVISRKGVFPDRDLRLLACRIVRETPLADGRKVWDLLTDERSRDAVIVAEKFANGEATAEELSNAADAANAAANAAYAAANAAYAAANSAATDADAYAAAAAAANASIIINYGNPFEVSR
jgi:hypothetical protein